MRTDPSENGGLFVGRRPGTAPIRFRALPQRGSNARQRIDNALARLLFAAMVIGCLLCWGPIPLACIWVSAQSNYLTGSVSLGFLLAIVALFVLLFGTLMILRRLDNAWIRRVRGRVLVLVHREPWARLHLDAGEQAVSVAPRTRSASRPTRPASR